MALFPRREMVRRKFRKVVRRRTADLSPTLQISLLDPTPIRAGLPLGQTTYEGGLLFLSFSPMRTETSNNTDRGSRCCTTLQAARSQCLSTKKDAENQSANRSRVSALRIIRINTFNRRLGSSGEGNTPSPQGVLRCFDVSSRRGRFFGCGCGFVCRGHDFCIGFFGVLLRSFIARNIAFLKHLI